MIPETVSAFWPTPKTADKYYTLISAQMHLQIENNNENIPFHLFTAGNFNSDSECLESAL